MQDETRTIVWVLASIILVVAAGYAGFASLENHLTAERAASSGAHPIVVHVVHKRAIILLVGTIMFWLAASAVFRQTIPERPGHRFPRFAISAAISGIAVIITIVVLHVTATLLKLV